MRDILRGKDPKIGAVADVIVSVSPDVILLNDIDYDLGLMALKALREVIAEKGLHFPYAFALRPNSGMTTGLDMDGDGRFGGARDNQGYGRFNGQGGMAILSRFPIDQTATRDFSNVLWRQIQGALLPNVNGEPFPSPQARDIQRLSSVGHWDVPVIVPGFGRLHLLAYHATPPVFDGPEDRNGKRNHDETRFWQLYLDGAFGPSPTDNFIIIGDANMDPVDGNGLDVALQNLLADNRIFDPMPMGAGDSVANPDHKGDPRFDTVDWSDPDPGNLRVDYVLPSVDLKVSDTAVVWPRPDDAFHKTVTEASRHRLVWVDIVAPLP